MVESARIKQRVRDYMAEHPGIKYQQALDVVRKALAHMGQNPGTAYLAALAWVTESLTASTAPAPDHPVNPASHEAWLAAIGPIDSADQLAQRWAETLTTTDLRAPLGVSTEGDFTFGADPEVVWLDLAEPKDEGRGPHGGIAGRTGTGKTRTMEVLLTGLATRYSPDRLQFVIAGRGNGGLLDSIAKLPHTALRFPEMDIDGETVAALLDTLAAEIDRRIIHVEDSGASSFEDYRTRTTAAGEQPFPALLVVIDEVEALTRECPEADRLLMRLARVGQASGIHLLLGAQTAPGKRTGLLEHLNARLCMAVHAKPDSFAMIGTDDAFSVRIPTGAGYLRTEGGEPPTPVRVFGMDSPDMRQLQHLIESMPKPAYRIADISEMPRIGERVEVEYCGITLTGVYAGRRERQFVIGAEDGSGTALVTSQTPRRLL